MASLHKEKNGYRIKWREGDRQRSKTVKGKADARRILRDIERQIEAAGYYRPQVARGDVTLEEVIAHYLIACEQVGKAEETLRRLRKDCAALLRYLAEVERHGGPFHPSVLSKSLLRGFYHSMSDLAQSTRVYRVLAIQHFWRWAANEDDTEAIVPTPKTIDLPPVTFGRPIAPTWAEVDAMIARLIHRRDNSRRGVVMAANACKLAIIARFTGLRARQVLSLRWSDLQGDCIEITPGNTKTVIEARGRLIPLSPHLLHHLRDWRHGEEFIIRRHSPSLGCAKSGYTSAATFAMGLNPRIRRAWSESGVSSKIWKQSEGGAPMHALRRCWTSEIARLGHDMELREYYLGHSLGVRGHYLDGDALADRLRELVAAIPTIGGGVVVPLCSASVPQMVKTA